MKSIPNYSIEIIYKFSSTSNCYNESAASSVASNQTVSKPPHYINFVDNWPSNEKENILNDFFVLPDFVSVEEEEALIEEIDPYMKRLKYEFDHWDDVRSLT